MTFPLQFDVQVIENGLAYLCWKKNEIFTLTTGKFADVSQTNSRETVWFGVAYLRRTFSVNLSKDVVIVGTEFDKNGWSNVDLSVISQMSESLGHAPFLTGAQMFSWKCLFWSSERKGNESVKNNFMHQLQAVYDKEWLFNQTTHSPVEYSGDLNLPVK